MQRQIHILPDFSGYQDAICFETQCSPDEVADMSKFAFEHCGPGYTPFSPGAIRLFHERLLLGQDMPPNLILTKWYRIDQILAATLFIQPTLALEPECTILVNSFDILDRLGDAMRHHVPFEHQELALTLGQCTTTTIQKQASVAESLEVVRRCADMIIRFVEDGQLPPISQPPKDATILADDPPFIVYAADTDRWASFYREGYLYGIWIHGKQVRARRKSNLVSAFALESVLKRFHTVDPDAGWEIVGHEVVGTPKNAKDFVRSLLTGFGL